MAAGIQRGLQAHDFTVDVTHDGAVGLWLATQTPYAAIVLDLMLPGLNGYRVCAELRRHGVTTPVLVLTAKDGEYDEAEALDTGADDYLTKPFSLVVLVARLRALVRRGSTPRPPALTAGTLVLDPFLRTCTRGDTPVRLTPRETDLLAALLRRSGGVASKIELLDEVWGADFEGDPNIVEVYMSYLRRKVDVPFGVATIDTVRGVGYRVLADA